MAKLQTIEEKTLYVLQLCHCYYPPFLDCARQYASLFKGTGYKVVTVYLTGEPDQQVAEQSDSDEVIFMGFSSKQVRGLKLNAIWRLKKILASKDFAFCIAHRSKPTYIALLAGNLPVVSVHHNYDDFGRYGRRLIVNLFRNRLLLLGVSDSVRDEMRMHLKTWPKTQIETLYNRIDIKNLQAQLLSKSDARAHLNLPQDAWIIGNVGRLHHDKDQATLLKGFQRALPALGQSALLVIMGKGPLEEELKQMAQDLGIASQVVFAGNVPEAKKYFRAFDVFALTSDHEPFGMVLLEAMAADLPLICSDCGGGREIVKDVGQLFPLADVAALSECLLNAYAEKHTFDAGKASKKLNDFFSDDAARKYFFKLQFVQNIIGTH